MIPVLILCIIPSILSMNCCVFDMASAGLFDVVWVSDTLPEKSEVCLSLDQPNNTILQILSPWIRLALGRFKWTNF